MTGDGGTPGGRERYLVFDTETTGLPVDWRAPASRLDNWPRLVQLAWLLCDSGGRPLDRRTSTVRPDGFEIPAAATRVHGITTAQAARDGLPLHEVLTGFSAAIDRSQLLIAHNVSYDRKVLGAEYLRAGLASRLMSMPSLCTMEASTEYCAIPGPRGFKWPSLSQLHSCLLGRGLERAHSAEADVDACAACFFELRRLGVLTLPATLPGPLSVFPEET